MDASFVIPMVDDLNLLDRCTRYVRFVHARHTRAIRLSLSLRFQGNVLAVCTLLRRRMRTLSTYTYLAALCVSNTITLVSVIIFEVDLLVEPNQFNCWAVSFAKALASSTLALSTW